jgi:hypothetical protein
MSRIPERRAAATALGVLLLAGCATALGLQMPQPPVNVIIEVRLAPTLPRADAIARAQDAVAAAIPPGRGTVSRRYRSLPFLAATIDPALLPTLQALPDVAAVRPDRMNEMMD